MEARVNTKPLVPDGKTSTVDWFDVNGSASVTGTLTRVQCVNRQFQLDVKDDMGKALRLLVVDPSQISILGGDGTLAWRHRKAVASRPSTISFKPTSRQEGIRR